MNTKYAVIIERANDGSYSAYVPDLPGCTSCAGTVDALRESIREAITSHIAVLKEFGEPVPPPISLAEFVDAEVAAA